MIYLTTGAPGGGKTLFTLYWVQKLAQKSSRPVYYDGIELKEPFKSECGWIEFDGKEWEKCPDGSIIVIDECQRLFRTRGPSQPIPPYEQSLDVHRHRGIDFFLITQHPKNISTFIRGLIGTPGWHRHFKRLSGLEIATCAEYNFCNTNCESCFGFVPSSAIKIGNGGIFRGMRLSIQALYYFRHCVLCQIE